MTATLEVTVGGLSFDDTTDDSGYRITTFEGWTDGPSARSETIERPTTHGDFDTPVTRGPRLITMSGWVYETDDTAMLAFRDDLIGLLATGGSDNISVTEFGVTTTANVRLYGDVTFARTGTTGFASWSVMFRAVNPRRYGASHTFGPVTSVTGIEHAGNFPADPVVVVAGSHTGGYTITGPNGELTTVTTNLVTGHPHTIDYRTGALTIDGARVVGGISVFEPWVVPKGATVSVSVDQGTIEVTVEDTYL